MTIDFIYWQKGTSQDGLSPYSDEIMTDINKLALKGLVTLFIFFPIEIDDNDGRDYSITDFALTLARIWVKKHRVGWRNLTRREGYKAALANFRHDYILNALISAKGSIGIAAKKINVNRRIIYRVLTTVEIEGVRNGKN